jgi:hypothetical protein
MFEGLAGRVFSEVGKGTFSLLEMGVDVVVHLIDGEVCLKLSVK